MAAIHEWLIYLPIQSKTNLLAGLVFVVNALAVHAADQPEFTFDHNDARAYKVESGVVVLIPVCPLRSKYSIKSGGLAEDPEFLTLCHIAKDTGLISVHRVPWNLRLSVIGDYPVVAFIHRSDTLYAIVEWQRTSSPSDPVKSSPEIRRFTALRGFESMTAPEDIGQIVAWHQSGESSRQLIKVPAWDDVENELYESRLRITDQVLLTYVSDPKHEKMIVQSESPRVQTVSIVP